MKAYIISYFGEKLETQWMRQALHYQQLCCLLQQPGIDEIVILAQDYDKLIKNGVVTRPLKYLILEHPRIRYIWQSDVLRPGAARNVLMKEFNKTQDHWAMFLDNDAIVDPRWHGTQVVNIIENNAAELAKRISVLSPCSPRHQPYTEFLTENKEVLETHLPLQKLNYNKTTLFFLRNETLQGKEPIFFDETLPSLEDYEYQARQLAAGGAIYQLRSVIMNDLGCNEKFSTLFPGKDGESNRTECFDKIKEEIFHRYVPYGLKKNSDGTSMRWGTIGKNNQLPKAYFIPLKGGKIETHMITNTFNNLFDEIED